MNERYLTPGDDGKPYMEAVRQLIDAGVDPAEIPWDEIRAGKYDNLKRMFFKHVMGEPDHIGEILTRFANYGWYLPDNIEDIVEQKTGIRTPKDLLITNLYNDLIENRDPKIIEMLDYLAAKNVSVPLQYANRDDAVVILYNMHIDPSDADTLGGLNFPKISNISKRYIKLAHNANVLDRQLNVVLADKLDRIIMGENNS